MSQPAEASSPSPAPSRAFAGIFWAGLAAGILDIGYVCIVFWFFNVPPLRILQGISTTFLGGKGAYAGGWGSASLGLAMHFGIAFTVAAAFYRLSRKFPVLIRHAALSGALYGVAVWLVMNLAVLPVVNRTKISFPPPQWELILLAHVICVGLPIALIVRHFSKVRERG